jgi:hypothetical protein
MTSETIVNHSGAWPIVVVTIHGTVHSDDVLNAAMTEWIDYMARGPHVLIIDLTQGNAGTTAAQRALIARRVGGWMKGGNFTSSLRNQLAMILVFDNAIVRGIITAVHWLLPLPSQYVTATNMDQAMEIAVAELAKAGISLTPSRVAEARTGIPTKV